MFNQPKGLLVTPEGQIIVADSYNHTIRLLVPSRSLPMEQGVPQPAWSKYFTNGSVEALAGGARVKGHAQDNRYRDDDASRAGFNHPCGLCILPDRGIAISELTGGRIRKLLTPVNQKQANRVYTEQQQDIIQLTRSLQDQASDFDFQTSSILDCVHKSRRIVNHTFSSVRSRVFGNQARASLDIAANSPHDLQSRWQVLQTKSTTAYT